MKPNALLYFLTLFLTLATAAVQAKTTVDVMVLYDDESVAALNGSPETKIYNWILEGNRIYQKSEVEIEIRLVHHQRWDPGVDNNQSEALRRLASSEEVDRLQEQYGADYITLLTAGRWGGIGYVQFGQPDRFRSSPRYARNVVHPRAGVTTFLHELGHNMTLGHSRRQGNVGGVYESGVGHGVDGLFGTVMAYAYLFNAPRIPQFSNSRQQCSGVPCGIPEGQPQSADAAYSLNMLRSAFAATMPTRVKGPGAPVEPPQAELAMALADPANDFSQLVVTHQRGDTLQTSDLRVLVDGLPADAGRQWQGVEALAPGDRVYYHSPDSGAPYFRAGQTVEIIHTPSETVIAETLLEGGGNTGNPVEIGAVVFKHWNYRGYAVELPPGRYTLADLRALGVRNDDLSSARLTPGFVMDLFYHDNFTGPRARLNRDLARFPYNLLNDTTSSIIVRDLNGSSPSGQP